MKKKLISMTADELLERRICCGLGCQNCPYDPPHKKGNKTVRSPEKRIRLGTYSKGAQSSHWDLDYMSTDELEEIFNTKK